MTDVVTKIISNSGVYQGRATTYVTNLGRKSIPKEPKINEPPATTISGYLGATTNGILDTRFQNINYYNG